MANKRTPAPPKKKRDEPKFVIDLDELTEPTMGLRLSATDVYPYKPWDSFTILERRAIAKDWDRVAELQALEVMGDDEGREHDNLARGVLRLICPELPEAKMATLNDTQVVEACSGFFLVQDRRNQERPLQLAQMTGTMSAMMSQLLQSVSKAAGRSPEGASSG